MFTRKRYRDIVLESLRYCQRHKGLHVNAYVVMSNHLHLVVWAEEKSKVRLSNIIRDFKRYTANQIYQAIQEEPESRREWLLYLFRYFARKHHPNQHFHFWQNDNHPIRLWSSKVTLQKLTYLHKNPVRAGLVEHPASYWYSSARNYSGLPGLLDVELLDIAYQV